MKRFFKWLFRFICALLSLARGIMVLCMLGVGVMTVWCIWTVGEFTYGQFGGTLKWQDTGYSAPLAEIEPVLVANRMDPSMVEAASAWERLESFLDLLDGTSVSDRDEAQALLDSVLKWKDVYPVDSDACERLSLYLELEDAIPEAYASLDTVKLRELSSRLCFLELDRMTVHGQEYMRRLRQVAQDFEDVRTLFGDTVMAYGTFEDGIWTVPHEWTRTEVASIMDKFRNMEKFPAVKASMDTLSDIAAVLNQNRNAREYLAYQEFKEGLSKAARWKYVPVSSIYTYQQAVDFGCTIQAEECEGWYISMDSPVYGLYYDGERLDSGMYVKRGTRLTAAIDEVYEPLPDDWEQEPELYELPMEEWYGGWWE